MPDEFVLTSLNLSETKNIGYTLGRLLKASDVVLLNGGLGAGKTTIAKSICKGIGVKSDRYVASPSYAIINEYDAGLHIYHFDLYRLESTDEFLGLGPYEYFGSDGVCIIEWGDKFPDAMPKERLELLLEYSSARSRNLTFTAHGKRYEKILKDLKKEYTC